MGIIGKIKEIGSIFNGIGQEVHIFDGSNGEVRVKDVNPMDYLYTGEQWCPNCHEQMILKGDYYECPICFKEIGKKDADDGYGYPTLESSYEEDFGDCYNEEEYDDESEWH